MFRIVDKPQPGFYKIQVVKDGPIMPAVIYRPCPIDPNTGEYYDRKRNIYGLIGLGSDLQGSFEVARKIWNSAEAISQKEYEILIDRVRIAHQTGAPEAYPQEPVLTNYKCLF